MEITINALSADSLNNAARQVRKLQKEYESKNRTFVSELLKEGIRVGRANLYGAGDSDPPDFNEPHVMMGEKGGKMVATLRLRGEDVAFVEFGAGISYNGHPNSSPHDLGVELGYTIGSYGFGQGLKETWFYRDDDGTLKESHGTEATMPLWKADQAIRNKFFSIAKQVFGS